MTSLFGLAKATGWSLYLEAPTKVWLASSVGEVRELINQAEAEARNGSYVALMLNYEAGPAFDVAFKTKQPTLVPLAWAAIYSASSEAPESDQGKYQVSNWAPAIDRNEYNNSVDRIRELITAGDTYQVNYTFPLTANFAGDPLAWYQDLCVAQGGNYSAFLDLGRFKILSLSPELFFQRVGDEIVTRPMMLVAVATTFVKLATSKIVSTDILSRTGSSCRAPYALRQTIFPFRPTSTTAPGRRF